MEILLDKRLQGMVNEYVPQGEILDDLVCFFSIFFPSVEEKVKKSGISS